MRESDKLRNNGDHCTFDGVKPKGIFRWIDFYQKNKPQTNAISLGIMLMIFGGQHLGWGIFNNHIKGQPFAGGYEDDGTNFWMIISWFIAGIVGFFISGVVIHKFSKISIYVFSSILAIVSSILFILQPASIYYIFPARILAGFSYGVAYPTVLMHASEVAIPKLRGMIVSLIPFAVTVGVFTTASSLLPVHQTRNYEVDPTKSIGINGLIIVLSGIFIATFFNRESPVFLIKKYREQEALDIMIRLRSESHETSEIRRDFNDLKLMVLEDSKSDWNIFSLKNRWPLFIVTIMKFISVASFNMPLNLIFLEAMETKAYNGETDASGMILSGVRWTVMIFMTFFIDLKRKRFYKISCGVSGTFLLLLFLFPNIWEEIFDEWTKTAATAVAIQMFNGFAFGLLPDVYQTEAFNTKKKPFSIAFASTFEFLLQISFVVLFYYFDVSSSCLMGCLGGFIMTGVILGSFLPDTSGLSLREARNRFNR